MPERNFTRAARYRTLALSECDSAKIALLHRLAEEAERGLLCTGKHIRLAYSVKAALAPVQGVGRVGTEPRSIPLVDRSGGSHG